jgi:hypothetical protein
MTFEEKLLYQLAGELSKAGAPVVIKGALVTKLILMEKNYDKVRQTRDIDMNWVKEPFPSMEDLIKWVNKSLNKIQDGLYAAVKREYIPGIQAAGFYIINRDTEKRVTSIDINAGFLNKSKIYKIGDAEFQGVLPSEILADKICILSGDRIFRRAKDVMDIYALSQCVDIQMAEILDICEKKGRKIDAFDNFCNRITELEHAYNKLAGIENKPPFADLYAQVSKFIRPFVEKDTLNQFWDHKNQTWHELSDINTDNLTRHGEN